MVVKKIDEQARLIISQGVIPTQVLINPDDYCQLQVLLSESFNTDDVVYTQLHVAGRPLQIIKHSGDLTVC